MTFPEINESNFIGPIEDEILDGTDRVQDVAFDVVLPEDMSLETQRQIFRQSGGQERYFGPTVDLKMVPFSAWLSNRGALIRRPSQKD